MKSTIYPATLLCDFYKVSHKKQYPKNTEVIYSTFTPRSNKYFPQAEEVVVFGIQAFVKKYLIEYFNTHFFNRPKEEIVAEFVRYIKHTLGEENPDSSHIEELHDLGYLPIEIKALKEGTKAPIKTPVLTMENTNPKFYWLTNYLETLVSAEIWQPMTSATTAYQYRKLLDEYAIKTTGNTDGVGFQGHDFSARGMVGLDGAAASGAGHLLSFEGTDTIPAIAYHEHYYNANIEKELVGASIPATEHSVMSASTDADSRDEYEMFKRLITEVYPTGFFSVVSDTYDFWKVIGEILPRLKDDIMARDGRVVIRPDSGDPVDIICGQVVHELPSDFTQEQVIEKFHSQFLNANSEKESYLFSTGVVVNRLTLERRGGSVVSTLEKAVKSTLEEKGLIQALWDIFRGTVTEQGYKVLDTHIGAIYGDSITLERAKEILARLEAKGFASTNIVLGIGSYTYQYNTRDSLGFAMKATYAVIDGEERMLFKDPKTDDGTKRSQRGRVVVHKNHEGKIVYVDGLKKDEAIGQLAIEPQIDLTDLLEQVFINGELARDQSLQEIRNILRETKVEGE